MNKLCNVGRTKAVIFELGRISCSNFFFACWRTHNFGTINEYCKFGHFLPCQTCVEIFVLLVTAK